MCAYVHADCFSVHPHTRTSEGANNQRDTCLSIYVYICVYTCTCVCVCVFVLVFVCVCVLVCVCIRVRVFGRVGVSV